MSVAPDNAWTQAAYNDRDDRFSQTKEGRFTMALRTHRPGRPDNDPASESMPSTEVRLPAPGIACARQERDWGGHRAGCCSSGHLDGAAEVAESTGNAVALLVQPRGARPLWVRAGESVSAGRAGTVLVGANDPLLHEVTCIITAGTTWTVKVPHGNRLWVDILLGRRTPAWSVAPGTEFACDRDHAGLRVRTAWATHRIDVRHATSAQGDEPRQGSSTRRATPLLRADDPQHRALIVACEDRLHHHGVGAANIERVAATLGISGPTADQRINRCIGDVKAWMELAGEPAPGKDRSAVVDWLVSTGLVTASLLNESVAAERRRRS